MPRLHPLLMIVDQPAKFAIRRAIDAPTGNPIVPPATSIDVVSMTNSLIDSVQRASIRPQPQNR
jgi:hypothetical protein